MFFDSIFSIFPSSIQPPNLGRCQAQEGKMGTVPVVFIDVIVYENLQDFSRSLRSFFDCLTDNNHASGLGPNMGLIGFLGLFPFLLPSCSLLNRVRTDESTSKVRLLNCTCLKSQSQTPFGKFTYFYALEIPIADSRLNRIYNSISLS